MKTNNFGRFATIFFLSAAFLTTVSCSQNANRSEKPDATYADSILVLINGEEWPDFPRALLIDGYYMENGTAKGIFSYFAERNLAIKSAVFWSGDKGEHVKKFYRRDYGDRVNFGILDIGVEPLVKSSDTRPVPPKEVVARVHRAVAQETLVRGKSQLDSTDEFYDELPDLNRPIGGEIPTSLVLINGKSSGGGFPDDHFENGAIKPFSAKELKEILKRKNFIFDDVKIVKDEKALEKYQREFGSICHKIEIVYEIKAHPINQKGEIFEVTAQMPYYPGGSKTMMAFIEKNIHRPEKMLQDSVHGKVVVQFIIEKDGSIEEYGIANNLLKDKSGNPCTDSATKKQCEEEALRVVGMMPRWEPGKNEKGEAVRVRVHIPVNF